MANYHPVKKNSLFSLPSRYVFTLLGERERKCLKMLCLCTLRSAHWLFAFSIIYPHLEEFSNYAFTCSSGMIMVIQKIATLWVAGKMHLYIWGISNKKLGLIHLRVKPTDMLHIHTPSSAGYCLLPVCAVPAEQLLTWGPQPWHGYNMAVWFSCGPWSRQTSFALLFRSCKK